jgi:hypothetical protein
MIITAVCWWTSTAVTGRAEIMDSVSAGGLLEHLWQPIHVLLHLVALLS